MGKKKVAELPKEVRENAEKAKVDFIEPIVQKVVMQYLEIQQEQIDEILNLLSNRIRTIETVLKNRLGVTDPELSNIMADIEDTRANQVNVEGELAVNDTVRCELSIKKVGEEVYPPKQNLKFVDIGGPQDTLTPEIRTAMLGMKRDEEKEVTINTPSGEHVVKIVINRISRNKVA